MWRSCEFLWRKAQYEKRGYYLAWAETAGQESRKQKTCLGNLLPKFGVIYIHIGDIIVLEVVLLLKYFKIIEHGKKEQWYSQSK